MRNNPTNTEQLDTNDWKSFKSEGKQRRENNRTKNTERAKRIALKYKLPLTPFNDGTMLRFELEGVKLDYYPTSNKVCVSGVYSVGELEQKIIQRFGLSPATTMKDLNGHWPPTGEEMNKHFNL